MGRASKGFSLLELTIAVAIVGILLLVGIPQIAKFRNNNNLKAAADTLVSDLNFARQSSNGVVLPAGSFALAVAVQQSQGQGTARFHTESKPVSVGVQAAATGPTNYNIVVNGQTVRSASIDANIKVLVGGPGTQTTGTPVGQVAFNPGGSEQDIGFNGNGTLAAGVFIQLSNGDQQIEIDMSHLGAVTVTNQPIGTAPNPPP